MKPFIVVLALLLVFFSSHGQSRNDSIEGNSRWQVLVGSGLFLDLFYKNIYIGNYGNSNPASYPDRKGTRVKPGKIDRVELMYNFASHKSAMSLTFQNALFNNVHPPIPPSYYSIRIT